MKIRKATLKDVGQIAVVFKDYETASVGYISKKYQYLRKKKGPLNQKIRLAIIKDIKHKHSRFLVMEDNDKIVGYIFGTIKNDKHPLFNPPKTGELDTIAVLKSYRGRGIASQLWKELLAWFKREKCKFITLSVNYNNPAQEIYQNWGFEIFYLRMIRKL